MQITEAIPANVRRPLYLIFALVGLGLGAAQVWYTTVQGEQPEWIVGALAVLAFVSAPFGITAASNTAQAVGGAEALALSGHAEGEASEVEDDDENPDSAVVSDEEEVPAEEIPGDWSGAESEGAPTNESAEPDATPVPEDYEPRH